LRRLALLAACLLVQLGLAGCERQEDVELSKKLDDIDKRLASIEEQIKKGGVGTGRAGAGRQRRPERPPGPDPKLTYAVPVEGAAFLGPKHAKVTIAMGFEFA
jgi:hypothetical protein